MNIREFLKKEKALTKFKKNFLKQKKEWNARFSAGYLLPEGFIDMSPERYLREITPTNAIMWGFQWDKTPEGNRHWSTLNEKYIRDHV